MPFIKLNYHFALILVESESGEKDLQLSHFEFLLHFTSVKFFLTFLIQLSNGAGVLALLRFCLLFFLGVGNAINATNAINLINTTN